MSFDKPPHEDEFQSSDEEMSEKKEFSTTAKNVGKMSAVEGEQVQVISEVITGTPSTLADLPSTEIQSILLPQSSKELTPLENDEAFRWRGDTAHKEAPKNDDNAASLSPSVLKDMPSTSTVVSLHLEQPELKPTTKASEAFLFQKVKPQSAQKKQHKVKCKPERSPQQQLHPFSLPNRQTALTKGEPKTQKNTPKPGTQVQVTTKTSFQTGKSIFSPTKQTRVKTSPKTPTLKQNQMAKEQTKIQIQKNKTAKKQKTPARSPTNPQNGQSQFVRKQFPPRVTPSSPITSSRLRSPPGKATQTTAVPSAASTGIKAAKKAKQTQTATPAKIEKAKTTGNAKTTKETKQNNGLLFNSYVFRPPPKE